MLLEGRDESLRSVPVAETSDRHPIAVFGLPPHDPCVLTNVNNGPHWTICVTGIGAQIPWLKPTHSAPPSGVRISQCSLIDIPRSVRPC
jgi:hypothetical protein